MKTEKHGLRVILVGMLVAVILSIPPRPSIADTTLLTQVTGYSYHVLFAGTFYEPGQAPDGTRRPYTLDVIVDGDKRWIFVVDKAVSLGRTATEIRILKSIFPPQLSFRGDKKALDFLLNPDIAGKPVTVQGHLYSKERRFHVLRAEPVPEEEEKAES